MLLQLLPISVYHACRPTMTMSISGQNTIFPLNIRISPYYERFSDGLSSRRFYPQDVFTRGYWRQGDGQQDCGWQACVLFSQDEVSGEVMDCKDCVTGCGYLQLCEQL